MAYLLLFPLLFSQKGKIVLKKLITSLVLGFFVSIGLIIGVHWLDNKKVENRLVSLKNLAEKQVLTSHLMVEFERYRRVSSGFKHATAEEAREARDRLKTEVNRGIALMNELEPTPEDRTQIATLSDQYANFLVASAQSENQNSSKDPYQKDNVRELQDQILGSLQKVTQSASDQQIKINKEIHAAAVHSVQYLVFCGVIAFVLIFLLFIREYIVYSRKLLLLFKYSQDQSSQVSEDVKSSPIYSQPSVKDIFQKLESTIGSLASRLEVLRNERYQFLVAVATDIRAPLLSLRSGAELLTSNEESINPSQRNQAMDLVRNSVFRLSKHLEDLNDLVEIDRNDIKLNEKIVDLGKVVQDLAQTIGCSRSLHPIHINLPNHSIWTYIDSQRVERVLIHLIQKVSLQIPMGGPIQISVQKFTQSSFRGLEISIQELPKGQSSYSTGPEQDVSQHWINNSGFGISLARKIVTAHGGALTASGIMGTGVRFSLRIPEERIISDAANTPLPASPAGMFEGVQIHKAKVIASDVAKEVSNCRA